ncbi:mucin-binding protein [Apilactobacillus quenuiae]|uniref:mucin-binding protein n=1 Tax=Apilactobacillus quenuiae TaxID=2008377 RepID=UPI000D018DAC|nr:DUF5776 domain-containing protein [Apilactobacillus quenuiae]
MQYRENQFNNKKWVIASVSMLSVIGFYFLSNGPTPIKAEAATNIAPNSASAANGQGASGAANGQGASGAANGQGASGAANGQGASGAANGQGTSSTLDVQGTPNKLSANSSLGSVLSQKNATTELQDNKNVSSATSLSIPSSKDKSLSPNNVKQTYGLTLSNNNQNNINNLKVNVNISDPNQVSDVQYDSNIFHEYKSGGNYTFTASQYPPVQSNIVFKLTTRSQEDNDNVQPVTIDGNYSYEGSSNNAIPDQVYYVHNIPKGASQGGVGYPNYLVQGDEFEYTNANPKYANANTAALGADSSNIHLFYDLNSSKVDGDYYQTFEAVNNSKPNSLEFSSDNYKIDTSSTRAIIRSNDGKYNYVIDPQNNITIYNTDGSKVSNEELSSNKNINNEKPLINWDIVNDHQVNISRANSYGSIYYLINHVLVDAHNETDALKANVEVQSSATYDGGNHSLSESGRFVNVPENYTNGYPFISGVADKTIDLTTNQPTYSWSPKNDISSGIVTARVYNKNIAEPRFSSLQFNEPSSNLPKNGVFDKPGVYTVTYSIQTAPDGRGYIEGGGTANINNQNPKVTQTITVIKTINNYVNYYDDTSNKLIKTDTLTGSQGSSINYVPDSSILNDSRYKFNKLTSSPLSSSSITLNKENDRYTLHFAHNISHSLEQKDVTATVKYLTVDGKEIAPNDEQKLSFSRDVAHDPVNNTDTYGQWNPNNNIFNQVTSPQIVNYSPDKTVIASIPNISGDSSNIVNYVTYRLVNNGSDVSPSTPNTNDNNGSNSQIPNANDDNSNPQSPNNHIKPDHSNPNKHDSHKKYHGIIGKRIYAIKGLNMYRKNYFIYKYKIHGFNKHIRINRPMFKVIDYARSSKGNLRYKVIRISPYTNRIMHGRNSIGYITARRNYVTKLYYEKKVRKIKIIAKGINEYKHLNLTKKVRGYKKNTILKVKSVRKMGTIYRLKIYNNDYITANKRYVKIINK